MIPPTPEPNTVHGTYRVSDFHHSCLCSVTSSTRLLLAFLITTLCLKCPHSGKTFEIPLDFAKTVWLMHKNRFKNYLEKLMNVRLVVRLVVWFSSKQKYGIRCESPQTMEFSGTAMHVQTLKDSVPLIWLLLPLPLFFRCPILSPLPLFLSGTTNVPCGAFSFRNYISFFLFSYEILEDWDHVLLAVCIFCMKHATGTMVGIAKGLLNSLTSHWNTDSKSSTSNVEVVQ